MQKLVVRTSDGGSVAVWVEGSGSPLVLIHGSLGDHTGFTALIDHLKGGFTTFAVDRRGFGASGDSEPYSLEREFHDVAAVVDAVTGIQGSPVTLFGHSFGANCAMGGAAESPHVHRLVLYEPSLGLRSPIASIEAVEKALASGDREAAVLMVLVEQLEMPPDQVAALRTTPRWPVLVAGAHTMPRETRAETDWQYTIGRFGGIAAPTLFLAGSESTPSLAAATIAAAAAIPDALIRVLPGHGHFAHRNDPKSVAGIISRFVQG